MQIELKIKRFNPETDTEPYVQDFTVEAQPSDRILDALMTVKRHQDGSLGFRKSCAHGVCGSDAMIINGTERLACKTLVQDVTDEDNRTVTIEPLRSMTVQRDLMVDQGPFFDAYRTVKPFLMNEESPAEKEFVQSAEEREKFDDPTKCILCSSCYSACPVVAEEGSTFVGPAAVVQASRFVLDSRDKGIAGRMDVLDTPNGVWACDNHFNCTKVCPRSIKVTKNINRMKREIKKHKEAGDQAP